MLLIIQGNLPIFVLDMLGTLQPRCCMEVFTKVSAVSGVSIRPAPSAISAGKGNEHEEKRYYQHSDQSRNSSLMEIFRSERTADFLLVLDDAQVVDTVP
ncbi:hypothetical protein [Burkholderia stagnalis]|uniref:hypothetical protein n=1 Tax=Burkholderia stagnalis TaxID=1503054 RepID=UPI0012D91435|nr:hypothetical protein [Burkholderia stagnalis]